MTWVYIYTLSDPRYGDTRYVGVSAKPFVRMAGHISLNHCHCLNNPAKTEWIRELKRLHIRPILRVVKKVHSKNGLREEERLLRQLLSTRNYVLLNASLREKKIIRGERTSWTPCSLNRNRKWQKEKRKVTR